MSCNILGLYFDVLCDKLFRVLNITYHAILSYCSLYYIMYYNIDLLVYVLFSHRLYLCCCILCFCDNHDVLFYFNNLFCIYVWLCCVFCHACNIVLIYYYVHRFIISFVCYTVYFFIFLRFSDTYFYSRVIFCIFCVSLYSFVRIVNLSVLVSYGSE